MTKLHDLITSNASIEAIKADLWDNRDVEGYVNAKENIETQPLHYAAYQNNPECIKLLLEAGANVNAKDDYGSTPLNIAAWIGELECVKCLLAAGADINLTNKYRHTAADVAREYGHHECLALLEPEGNYAMINGVKYKLLRCKS
jgi:ankyrin repeat protein